MGERVLGLVMTIAIHSIVTVIVFSRCDAVSLADSADEAPQKKQVIEASLAFKSQEKIKQPQKQRSVRTKREKIPGVVQDPDTKPIKREKKPKRKRENFEELLERYEPNPDDLKENPDLEAGKEAPKHEGTFDGSKKGFAKKNAGHPWMRELAGDFHSVWKVPEIEKNEGVTDACIQVLANGRIKKTKLWPASKNANLNRSVKLALRELKNMRNRKPKPVPASLIDQVTTGWQCFRASLKKN